MIFRRKQKPPLAQAEKLVQEAVVLIHSYWRDESYKPSQPDLKKSLQLEDMLLRSHAAVRRIALRMERRFHGEPEINEQKWLR